MVARLFGVVRGGSFWRVVPLLLVLATVQSCKPSKAQTDLDMVGTYSLSRNTSISLLDEFDYVGRVSAIVLRPDHTFSVTNFPVLEGGSRWTPGVLISTNGQWTITTQTEKTEWGMSQYTVHKLALQIAGMDAVQGHISRWGVEVQFLVSGASFQGQVSYRRAD